MSLNLSDIKEKSRYVADQGVVMHILQDGHEAVVLADGPSAAWDAFEQTYGVAVDVSEQDGAPALLDGYKGDVLMALRRDGVAHSSSKLLVAKINSESTIEDIQAAWEDVLVKDGREQGNEGYFEAFPVYQNSDFSENRDFVNLVVESHQKACELRVKGEMPSHETIKDRALRFVYNALYDPEQAAPLPRPNDAFDEAEEIIRDNYEQGLQEITQWVRFIDPDEAERFYDSVFVTLREGLEVGLEEQDGSRIEDWLKDEVIMQCRLTQNEHGPEDSLVYCDGITGDADNLIIDDNFRSMLKALNLSGQEWVDHLRQRAREAGGDRPDFDAMIEDINVDKLIPEEAPFLTAGELSEAFDNSTGYGMPTIALRVAMSDLIELDPGEAISLKGGVAGVFSPINGSGSMEYFSGEIKTTFTPNNWVLDGEQGYGVDSTFGFTGSSYRGELKAPGRDESRRQMAVDYVSVLRELKEAGSLTVKEDQTYLDTGIRFVDGIGFGGRNLVSAVEQKMDELGVYIDVSGILTEQEVSKFEAKKTLLDRAMASAPAFSP